MAAGVDNPESAYRQAITAAQEIQERAKQRFASDLNRRFAGKQPHMKSVVHAGYLQSLVPPAGRGYDMERLPEEMDDIFPLRAGGPVDGGDLALPLNADAIAEDYHQHAHQRVATRTAAKGGKNDDQARMRQLFSTLEQDLYRTILGLNIPYAFYAQYTAGPGQQYQLDGAFPQLKLGVEADSRTFHNSPEKIADDRRRDMELASQGWTVLRFTEEAIRQRPQDVSQVVIQILKKLAQAGGRG
jgi:very-short-patch-repair endonuclease